jgi:hypothetical protein
LRNSKSGTPEFCLRTDFLLDGLGLAKALIHAYRSLANVNLILYFAIYPKMIHNCGAALFRLSFFDLWLVDEEEAERLVSKHAQAGMVSMGLRNIKVLLASFRHSTWKFDQIRWPHTY